MAKGSETKSPISTELLIAEFDALRREIEVHISERRKIESQVIIGVAILYSWVFTRQLEIPVYLFKGALAIAPVLTLLGFLRWSAIQLRTMKIGEYLASDKFVGNFPGEIGWEQFLSQHRKHAPMFGRFEGWSEFLVWTALFLATLLVLGFVPAPSAP